MAGGGVSETNHMRLLAAALRRRLVLRIGIAVQIQTPPWLVVIVSVAKQAAPRRREMASSQALLAMSQMAGGVPDTRHARLLAAASRLRYRLRTHGAPSQRMRGWPNLRSRCCSQPLIYVSLLRILLECAKFFF